VTENGMGSNRETLGESGAIVDNDRIDYLRAHIGAMNDAAAAGADIRGYFVWSLLDNFEWDAGYSVRLANLSISDPTAFRRLVSLVPDLIKARGQSA
jgi:beta-glucosidase